MDVTVVCSDLSHNCLGRAHLLAELLERNYSVEVIGPEVGDSVWGPVEDEFDYVSMGGSNWVTSMPSLVARFLDRAEGEVLYVSKPKLFSYGLALPLKFTANRPVILDIDDWEAGFRSNESFVQTYLGSLPRLVRPDSIYWIRAMEALSGLSDAVTVSNTFLQDRFGGEIIPHVRDTEAFDPDRFDGRAARVEHGIPTDSTVVMFSGTPRPHKGVEELLEAVSACPEDVVGVIVGANESEYTERLRQRAGDQVMIFGQQPFDELPRWIAAADIVAIPQRETPSTVGQLPAKMFDAMAMAKPIIATDVSDLARILDGCGLVIDPGDTAALRDGIQRLKSDPDLRRRLGRAARERCLKQYSYDATAPRVASVVEPLL